MVRFPVARSRSALLKGDLGGGATTLRNEDLKKRLGLVSKLNPEEDLDNLRGGVSGVKWSY